MRSTESPAKTKDAQKAAAGAQISSGTQTSPDSSKESVIPKESSTQPGVLPELQNGGEDVIPKSSSSTAHIMSPSKRSGRKGERSRTRSPAGTSQRTSTGSRRKGFPEEKVPVKEAMSPSVAESIRSVFAAFVWHEGIVHDAMAVASYLKFDPTLTKQGSLGAGASTATTTASATAEGASASDDKFDEQQQQQQLRLKEERARQRHSVEVISTSYLMNYRTSSASSGFHARSGVDTIVEKSAVNANTNRNIAGSRASASATTNDSIPENVAIHFDASMRQMVDSGLPPTVGYLVLLWEEIRSYCIHAILQQVSPCSSRVMLKNSGMAQQL